VDLDLESLDALEGVDTVLLFVRQDERPLQGLAGFLDWRMCGAVSRLLVDNFFQGTAGEALLLPTDGRVPPSRIMVVGLGRREEVSAQMVEEALKAAAVRLNKAQVQGVAMEPPGAGSLDDETRAKLLSSSFVPEFTGQRLTILAERALGRFFAGEPPARSAGR
jgi:hypothetical protein